MHFECSLLRHHIYLAKGGERVEHIAHVGRQAHSRSGGGHLANKKYGKAGGTGRVRKGSKECCPKIVYKWRPNGAWKWQDRADWWAWLEAARSISALVRCVMTRPFKTGNPHKPYWGNHCPSNLQTVSEQWNGFGSSPWSAWGLGTLLKKRLKGDAARIPSSQRISQCLRKTSPHPLLRVGKRSPPSCARNIPLHPSKSRRERPPPFPSKSREHLLVSQRKARRRQTTEKASDMLWNSLFKGSRNCSKEMWWADKHNKRCWWRTVFV